LSRRTRTIQLPRSCPRPNAARRARTQETEQPRRAVTRFATWYLDTAEAAPRSSPAARRSALGPATRRVERVDFGSQWTRRFAWCGRLMLFRWRSSGLAHRVFPFLISFPTICLHLPSAALSFYYRRSMGAIGLHPPDGLESARAIGDRHARRGCSRSRHGHGVSTSQKPRPLSEQALSLSGVAIECAGHVPRPTGPGLCDLGRFDRHGRRPTAVAGHPPHQGHRYWNAVTWAVLGRASGTSIFTDAVGHLELALCDLPYAASSTANLVPHRPRRRAAVPGPRGSAIRPSCTIPPIRRQIGDMHGEAATLRRSLALDPCGGPGQASSQLTEALPSSRNRDQAQAGLSRYRPGRAGGVRTGRRASRRGCPS